MGRDHTGRGGSRSCALLLRCSSSRSRSPRSSPSKRRKAGCSPAGVHQDYAMAAAAGLSVTLIPVLMGYWIAGGRIPDEQKNPPSPASRLQPTSQHWWVPAPAQGDAADRRAGLGDHGLALARLGGEFRRGWTKWDLLYMPSALPGLSAQRATELLQLSNRMIKTVHLKWTRCSARQDGPKLRDRSGAPGDVRDHGEAQPREQWRPGMTPEKLVEELDRAVKIPACPISGFPYSQSHRYAGYWHQEPNRGEGDRQRPGVIDRIAAEVEQVPRAFPA